MLKKIIELVKRWKIFFVSIFLLFTVFLVMVAGYDRWLRWQRGRWANHIEDWMADSWLFSLAMCAYGAALFTMGIFDFREKEPRKRNRIRGFALIIGGFLLALGSLSRLWYFHLNK